VAVATPIVVATLEPTALAGPIPSRSVSVGGPTSTVGAFGTPALLATARATIASIVAARTAVARPTAIPVAVGSAITPAAASVVVAAAIRA
jgi:hypothetical protein